MNRRQFIKTGLIFVPTWFVCKGGAVSLSNLHPEVYNWIARMRSNSAGYTSTSIVCNDWMMKALVANNLRSRIVRMGTFTGIGINAIKTPLIEDVNTGVVDDIGLFADGDFSEGTGLTGNGTTKFMQIGCKLSDLYALDGTNHSFAYGCYVCPTSNNQNGFAMGTYDGGDYTYLYVSNGSSQTYFSGGATANQIGPLSDSAGSGFYCGSRNSATSMKLYKRGVEIGTTATPGNAQNNGYWLGVFDVNNQNSNVVVAPSTKTFGGYVAGNSFDATQQVVLDYIWTRGMTILGRQAT